MATRAVGCLAATMLALPWCATAQALPADPAVEALTPADGATVTATAAGVTVTYTCPAYRQDEFGSMGGPTEYDADFARTPSVGADGRLSERSSAEGVTTVGPDGVSCVSALGQAGGSDFPEQTGGRVYWQAYRDCLGCPGNRPETGPVRSFVVQPAPIPAALEVTRLYAGYAGIFTVTTKAKLGGARVTLQREVAKQWRTIADDEFSARTELIAALPAGRSNIRAVAVTPFSTLPLATRTVTVRHAGRRVTSVRADGRYAQAGEGSKSLLRFGVSHGGRTLRDFRAAVTTACLEGTAKTFTFRTSFAAFNRVPIAPDGSVVALLRGAGGSEQRLVGRLRGRRFTGTIFLHVGRCTGTRTVKVVRTG